MVVRGLPAARLSRLDDGSLTGAEGEALLQVRTAASAADQPAIFGRRRVVGDLLRFVPRLPFRAGLGYRARFDGARFDRLTGAPPGTTPVLEISFEPAPRAAPPGARVEAVYPSADVLPENQLRLYVWFTTPMRRRDVATRIRLVEAGSSRPVEEPFVEIPDGLWDPSGRRLTLFFHPGRVKRGVGPNLAMGPPLRRGGSYRLEIGAALRDAAGRPLAEGHVKTFAVGPADRRSPLPAQWRLTPPATPGSPVEIEFTEPLDHGLLLRLLQVVDGDGEPVPGEVAIAGGETRWSFRPRRPWGPGSHRVRVDGALEDLAGNSLGRLFDEAAAAGGEPRRRSGEPVELAFRVSAGDAGR